MNRNENEAESFGGNFVASGEQKLFFEVPYSLFIAHSVTFLRGSARTAGRSAVR
jgi:hypothetical protein